MAMGEDKSREEHRPLFRMGTISTGSDPEGLREIRAARARLEDDAAERDEAPDAGDT